MAKEKIVVECEKCGRLMPTGLVIADNGEWEEDPEAKNTRLCPYCSHLNPSKLDSKMRPMYKRVYFTSPN